MEHKSPSVYIVRNSPENLRPCTITKYYTHTWTDQLIQQATFHPLFVAEPPG